MDLPRIWAKPNVPTYPGLPRVTGESYGAGVFNVIGEGADAFIKIQDTADRMEAARVAGEATETIAGTIRNNNQQIADPDEFVTRTSADIDSAHKTARDSLKNDRARKLFDDATANDLAKAKKAIEFDRYRKTGEQALGDLELSRKQMLDNYARADTPEERRAMVEGYGTLLGVAQKNGLMKPDKVVEEGNKFIKDADNARAGEMLFKNPRLFKAIVETDEAKKQFPGLSGQELYTWGQRATELIKEREQENSKAEKEKKEKVNQEMLSAITAPGASLVKLRENVRSRIGKDLEAAPAEHWIGKIDSMIKASQKEPKERDPFKTSDGATLARVMAGVTRGETDKDGKLVWDDDKILALMGNGLSVPHALQAVNIARRAEKDPPGTLTPLKMAQQSWSKQQSSLSFITQEEAKSGGPEAIMKNSREAQKIWDAVMARPNEDPRVVLEELMQPHYDSKIKSRFNPMALFDFSMTREEEVAARQALIRAGSVVNDEKIKATVEYQRKKKQPSVSPRPATEY